MHIKAQRELPRDAIIKRIPAAAVAKSSPFWRRESYAAIHAEKRLRIHAMPDEECDDCGTTRNLLPMGEDELGPCFLCQTCVDTKGTLYSND